METYGFLDPASGKVKIAKIRAQSAIIIIHVDHCGRIFVLDAWADRVPTLKLLDKVYELNEIYRPRIFGCEANAMQSLFVDLFQEHAKANNKTLPLVPVTQNTKIDKDFRIRATLQPVLNQHRLFLRNDPNTASLLPGMEQLRKQISDAPGGTLKDMTDALASVVALAPPRTTAEGRNSEREKLIEHHRRVGSSNQHLAERLAEFDRHDIMGTQTDHNFDV